MTCLVITFGIGNYTYNVTYKYSKQFDYSYKTLFRLKSLRPGNRVV